MHVKLSLLQIDMCIFEREKKCHMRAKGWPLCIGCVIHVHMCVYLYTTTVNCEQIFEIFSALFMLAALAPIGRKTSKNAQQMFEF